MRVDKWIWAVRMVKSRTLAGDLCKRGKVEVNERKAKPATAIKIDDIVTVTNGRVWKKYKVTGFIPKRVSAELAAKNYEDLTPAAPDEPAHQKMPRLKYWGQRIKGEGRPTKKDWRDIDRAKNQYE